MYIYALRAIPKGDVCLGCQGKLLSFGNFPNLGFLKSKLKKKDLCDCSLTNLLYAYVTTQEVGTHVRYYKLNNGMLVLNLC